MTLRKLRVMCAGGDETVAEWDTETVTPERLAEIEQEFNQRIAEGWFAADISTEEATLIQAFRADADILLIPKVQGGAQGRDRN